MNHQSPIRLATGGGFSFGDRILTIRQNEGCPTMPVSTYQKKSNDNDIVNLNNVGLSLCTIAGKLKIHHTTVTYRLKTLGIQPADTRRAFMEDIYESLSEPQKGWLIDQLSPGYSVKDFVRSLLIREFMGRQTKTHLFKNNP
jgi:hypothetical protein